MTNNLKAVLLAIFYTILILALICLFIARADIIVPIIGVFFVWFVIYSILRI